MLREHPGVFDCVVVGVPDERFGEMVVALVQPTKGTDVDADVLATWSRDRIAGYKRPKHWILVDSLDRNAAGKANHPRLRELATSILARR